MAFDRVLSFVTTMFVEPRSLEAVSEKDHLCAATPPGLCFGSLNESLSETATAVPLVDPDGYSDGDSLRAAFGTTQTKS